MDINWFKKITADHYAAKLNMDEIRLAIRDLRKRNILPDEDGCYQAWIHADQEFDLLCDTRMTSIFQISAPRGETNPLIKGSLPTVYGCKFHRYSQIEDRPYVSKEDFVIETGSSLSNDKHLAIFKGFENKS